MPDTNRQCPCFGPAGYEERVFEPAEMVLVLGTVQSIVGAMAKRDAGGKTCFVFLSANYEHLFAFRLIMGNNTTPWVVDFHLEQIPPDAIAYIEN